MVADPPLFSSGGPTSWLVERGLGLFPLFMTRRRWTYLTCKKAVHSAVGVMVSIRTAVLRMKTALMAHISLILWFNGTRPAASDVPELEGATEKWGKWGNMEGNGEGGDVESSIDQES